MDLPDTITEAAIVVIVRTNIYKLTEIIRRHLSEKEQEALQRAQMIHDLIASRLRWRDDREDK